MLRQCCVNVLVRFRFRHKDHLVRVRKQFGLLGLVATAGKCLEISSNTSSGFMLKNVIHLVIDTESHLM